MGPICLSERPAGLVAVWEPSVRQMHDELSTMACVRLYLPNTMEASSSTARARRGLDLIVIL